MRRNLFGTAAFCLAAWALPAAAQLSDNTLKLGVATDLSSLYADINGPGAVLAVQMAIEDFGGSVLGQKIELVSGDIQNKADVAATTVGRWYDNEKVDMVMGAGASSSSIAAARVAWRQEADLHRPRPRLVGSHRQALQSLPDPLGLRHRRAGQRHRLGGREGRRARPGSSSPPTMPSATALEK
jgi:hypothetical protein